LSDDLQGTEIAIIGLTGRFPGAANTAEFWRNLADGVESISFFSTEELLREGASGDVIVDPAYVGARGVVHDAEWFDASFFGFAPRQAEVMDPQHRLFMECAWEVLESAGYDPQRYPGAIGVYGGASMSSYLLENLASNRGSGGGAGGFEVVIANDKDYLATGVSYRMNLKGPSVTVQTSCSTSLVAVHLACQSLLNGECDMALAGGVSIVFPQKAGYVYREGGTRSPDGHCRAFDAKAKGIVGGSGVGLVLLKRLESALEDRDHIRAVIRGSAVNNDGSLKVGYTAPSVEGQAAVISEAQAVAGVDPATISYIEAHGTGTRLGDPCEIRALAQAFRAGTDRRRFCAIGSVKTNIGHLDVAAGVAGLIKTVLALENRRIPASLHFEQPNPEIDFDSTPFFVNDKLAEWPTGPTPRRAGVSSFGIGGTNAHVVLEEAPQTEEAPEPESPPVTRSHHVLVLSAKSRAALDRATSNLADHLKASPGTSLADVAHTLQVGRSVFPHRRTLVCEDREHAIALLERPNDRRVGSHTHEGPDPVVVFMFTGQGAQRVHMGAELYRTEPVFRRHLDECCDAFRAHLGFDLRDLLYPGTDRADEAARQLDQTQFTQPAMFAFEYALAKLWISWGIRPQAMIGHSVGEYTAACLAGVFTLEDAVALVARRGRLMGEMPTGDMLSVPLPESELAPLLGDELSVAAINGPRLCVASGPKAAVDALEAALERRGCAAQRLRTSHAFHSAMMDPIVEPFADLMRNVQLEPPAIPFISNLTGDWIRASDATDPSYWARHLREAVRFSQGVELLLAEPNRILLEVGPGTTLRSLAAAQPAKHEPTTVLASLPHAKDKESDHEHMLQTLGQLWMRGCRPDWPALYPGEKRRRVPLPTYPFERQRYWIAPGSGTVEAKPAPRREVTDWLFEPSWKRSTLRPGRQIEKGTWLLFVDDSGVGQQMAQMLASQGSDAICVSIGSGFARTSERTFSIDPGRRADYVRLFAELSQGPGVPSHIVHLWSVDRDAPYHTSPDLFERRQQRAFYSLLYLVQALSEAEVTTPLQLSVVTSQVQDVTGNELLCPDKATVVSAVMTIGTEFPHIRRRCVDILVVGPDDVSTQARNVLAEVTANAADLVVAWRGQYRWLQSFEPMPLASTAEPPARLRERGTYLITGGLGGVGLALAEHLARTVRAKLVLVGRTELPARQKWDEIARSASPTDPVGRRIRSIRSMEASGSEVLACRADVADMAEMSDVLSLANARFGPVHGVIHAAGLPGGGVMLRQTPETVRRVFAAKVSGTLVLDELLRTQHLDFFVLCSSQTAFLGLPGRSEYSAANRFMDAYARHRAKAGDGFVTSINWDTWQDVGMAVQSRKDGDGTVREVFPELGLKTSQGLDIFTRVLKSDATQVLVAIRGVEAAASDARTSPASTQAAASDARGPRPSAHPRPELQTEYEAPRTDAERSLTRIWQDVLGIELIGIHDNYYELGGDSVGGIQVVAKANQVGLALSIKHILQHQTIAELASVASSAARIEAEQGAVTGPVLLTPIQHWFFERQFAAPHHYNQSVLLEEVRPLDVARVRDVLTRLEAHHDALRSRFTRDESGWRQIVAEPGAEAVVRQVDLRVVPDGEVAAAIEAAAAESQGALDLSRGPLLQATRFDLGAHRPGRWLVCIHHLAVDNLSWRFLLEDFEAIYQSLGRGERVTLPPKTVSFKEWSARLNEHARSEVVTSELDHWLSVGEAGAAPLTRDVPDGGNTYGSKDTVSSSLTAAETHLLLDDARKAWNARVDELLLTATAQAFSRWSGRPALLLELEGHGREEFIEGIDVSRTAGWFTTMYPVALQLRPGARPGDAIRTVKEQLRAIPNNGMNFGLLRYLNPESGKRLARLPHAEIVFLYLGTADQAEPGSSLFKQAAESRGPAHAPANERPHLMELAAGVAVDQLTVSLTFGGKHRRETAQALVTGLVKSLRVLIRHRPAAAAGTLTPADFPLADVDQRTLDTLLGDDPRIEDIYPLSPLQQGLLFHSLYDRDSGGYFEQLSCTLEGDLDLESFQRAWQQVVDRHPALRTSFRYENLDKPLQIIHGQVALPWGVEDWRSLPQTDQGLRLTSLLAADRERGLDLTAAPLMRVTLVRLGERTFQFVWSYSHLLLDGWSGPLIIREVMSLYEGFRRGEAIDLPPARPFRDYIAWHAAQSHTAAEFYWRSQMAGFTVPTPVGGSMTADQSPASGRSYRRRPLPLPASTTDALREYARRHHLTLNTVLQGAWGLVLACISGSDDVVFGVSVSGRPPQLEGVDSIVGLFINTLPLRIRLNRDDGMVPWLTAIQAGQAKQRDYEYSSLVDVHGWSDVPRGRPLFESLLVFKNHPVGALKGESALTIRDLHADDASHYALTLDVTLRPDLLCRLNYDTRRFDDGAISSVLGYLEAAVTTMVAVAGSENKTVGDVLEATLEYHRREQQSQAKAASRKKLDQIARKPVRSGS
jgi:non-ribosomal peptide synthase protein (TIGR01720 family)